MFARWNPEGASLAEPRLDEDGERLWTEARARWSDQSAHDAFVKHCSQAGLLAVAGRLYRDRIDHAPQDDVAARMQKRIVAMATATLQPVTRRPVPVTRSRWFWVVVGLCVVAGALAGAISSAWLKR